MTSVVKSYPNCPEPQVEEPMEEEYFGDDDPNNAESEDD